MGLCTIIEDSRGGYFSHSLLLAHLFDIFRKTMSLGAHQKITGKLIREGL